MDPLTLTAIAQTAVGFIAAHLAKAGDNIISKAGEDLYGLIKKRLAPDHGAPDPLGELSQKPHDPETQQTATRHLEAALSKDPQLAALLRDKVQTVLQNNEARISIRAGQGSNVVGQVIGNVTFGKP